MPQTRIVTPAKLTGLRREFTSKLALIHHEAHRLGLYRTGQKLHEAVREVGYEIADCETGKQTSTPEEFRSHG